MRRRLGAALAAPAGWAAGGLGTLRSDVGLGGGLGASPGSPASRSSSGRSPGSQPALAIGLSVGLVFALLAFTNLGGAFVVFTFLAFLEFAVPCRGCRQHQQGRRAGAGDGVAGPRRDDQGRESTFLTAHPGITYLLLAFLGWSVLSTTWSASTGDTLVAVSRYLLDFTLLVIAFTAIRAPRVRDRLLRRVHRRNRVHGGLRPDPHADDRLRRGGPPGQLGRRRERARGDPGRRDRDLDRARRHRAGFAGASLRRRGNRRRSPCSASCSPDRAAA